MDKIKQIIADFLSIKFEDWKPYLTETEQAVFILFYFKGKKDYQIAMELNYSDRQIRRILKSARKKIYRLLP
jgi:RNA polymerase sigma factor (sigma-70 family)